MRRAERRFVDRECLAMELGAGCIVALVVVREPHVVVRRGDERAALAVEALAQGERVAMVVERFVEPILGEPHVADVVLELRADPIVAGCASRNACACAIHGSPSSCFARS